MQRPGAADLRLLPLVTSRSPVIRWIFRQYADGVSPRDIAKKLNAQGARTTRG